MRLFKILRRKLSTAATLTPGEVYDVFRAWWCLGLVQAGIAVLPYRWWKSRFNRVLQQNHVQRPTGPATLRRCRRQARAVAIAARNHVLPINCLGRSLALHALCGGHGESPVRLAIGVRKHGGALYGHAWLEADGDVLNDAPEHIVAFHRLDRLPALQPKF